MINGSFEAAWPDCFDVEAEIHWSEPVSYEYLFNSGMLENETAYFYSIVAKDGRSNWWPYYIGMTCCQTAEKRNRQRDHVERRSSLQAAYPKLQFMITLGTPEFKRGKPTDEIIRIMEGILIYGNWHEEMVNKKKVKTHRSVQHIFIRNTGWSNHVEPELAFGVFYKGHA